MGLFDFFKKKNTVTQPRNITSDLGTYEKNGIRYHRYSKTMNGATITESVPEYNEILVFYTFLNKYPKPLPQPSHIFLCIPVLKVRICCRKVIIRT